MKTEKNDIVIASLEFARDRYLKGEMTYRRDFDAHLESLGYDPIKQTRIMETMFVQIFCRDTPTTYSSAVSYFMSLDSYMALKEHEELQLARADSAGARKEARNALWIGIGSLVLAAIVGVIQIYIDLKHE